MFRVFYRTVEIENKELEKRELIINKIILRDLLKEKIMILLKKLNFL